MRAAPSPPPPPSFPKLSAKSDTLARHPHLPPPPFVLRHLPALHISHSDARPYRSRRPSEGEWSCCSKPCMHSASLARFKKPAWLTCIPFFFALSCEIQAFQASTLPTVLRTTPTLAARPRWSTGTSRSLATSADPYDVVILGGGAYAFLPLGHLSFAV